ncbi:hypothetical protein ACFC60_22195 [Kitasatospora purpeofusca]|uniref:hypothetical protein n=1 Tax=Kitasatospora purpeofusca TaxID=67352 RepID=UPI0035DD8D8F
MSTPEKPPTMVYNLSLRWPREQPKAQPANQFAIAPGLPARSGQPDEVYLVIGHADPPFLSASQDGMTSQPEALEAVPIDVVGRYVLTRNRLGELAALLQAAVEAYDRATGGEQGEDVRNES